MPYLVSRTVEHGPIRIRAQGRDRAGVADLAAGLRVERRAVEHDLDGRAFGRFVDRLSVDDERDDGGLADRFAGGR